MTAGGAISLVNEAVTNTSAAGSGFTYTLPSGAPSAGELDVLCVNSDTTVSTPTSASGASWALAESFINGQGSYIWYRVANGAEPSTVVITTSGNHPTVISWSRWDGAVALDQVAVSHVDGTNGTSTPAVTTPVLSQTGELVVAFGALHVLTAGAPSAPSWSSGYSVLTSYDGTGTGGSDAAAYCGYKLGAGTAAESPQVSWTTSTAQDRYMLVATFTAGGSPLTVTTTQLPDATEGAPYSQTLSATGGTAPYTWSISSGSLPGWASLNSSTGVISGTAPGFAQATQFTVEATDAVAATATQQLILPVGPYPLGQPSGGPWVLAFNDDFDIPYTTPYGTGPNPAVWADHLVNGDYWRCNDDPREVEYGPARLLPVFRRGQHPDEHGHARRPAADRPEHPEPAAVRERPLLHGRDPVFPPRIPAHLRVCGRPHPDPGRDSRGVARVLDGVRHLHVAA